MYLIYHSLDLGRGPYDLISFPDRVNWGRGTVQSVTYTVQSVTYTVQSVTCTVSTALAEG